MKVLRTVAAVIAVLGFSTATAGARPVRMCPMIYKPVCARTVSGYKQTFSNECEARNARGRVLYDGRCRDHHHH